MVRERQGEKVGENCMVEQCLQSDTQAVGKKRVWGTYHEPPWNQNRGIGTAYSTVEAGTGG